MKKLNYIPIYILLVSILLFSCKRTTIGLNAQLSGTVKNESTQLPIAGAVVTLKNKDKVLSETSTSSSGSFKFTDLGTGTYTLIISLSNYSEDTKTVLIEKVGETIVPDILLAPYHKPVLTTLGADNIDLDKATLGGNITDVGLKPYTECGVIYSLIPNPTILIPTKMVSTKMGTSGTFTVNVTGLSPRTTYYARAYAINNNADIVYGSNEIQFITIAGLPKLTTLEATNFTNGTSALVGGYISNMGSPAYTERGIYYGTTQNPDISGTKISIAGTGLGNYSYTLSGLSSGTIYHVKAYATNSEGTNYGNLISFDPTLTFPIQSIYVQRADLGTMNWNSAVTACQASSIGGYQDWRLPTIDELSVLYTNQQAISGFNTTSGTNSSWYWSATASSSDHYTKLFTNGNQSSANTGAIYAVRCVRDQANSVPTLSTSPVTNITSTTATLNANVVANGTYGYTERGLCYATHSIPTTSDNKVATTGTGIGSFTKNITGLTQNTTYFVRAYAIHSTGTVYSDNEISFIASDVVIFDPLMIQRADLGATTWSAANAGCAAQTTGGYLDWRLPTIAELATMYTNKTTIGGFSTGAYWSSSVYSTPYYYIKLFSDGTQSNASNGSTFNYRCVRTNAVTSPTLSTNAISTFTATTAILGGNILTLGSVGYTERGVCYSSSSSTPNITHTKIVIPGTGTGTYNQTITGLTANTTYYVSAYVINNGTPVYGTPLSFKTLDGLPALTTTAASTITATTAILGGNITNIGDPAYTERGVCYSTSNATPTINDTKVIITGTGTGAYSQTITGLIPNTTYWVRAYAINNGIPTYGTSPAKSFITSKGAPSVTLNAASLIADNSLAFYANVTYDGGYSVNDRGFCWNTAPNPTKSNTYYSVTLDGLSSFVGNLTGLYPNTTYYVKAWATNAAGIGYSNQQIVTTNASGNITCVGCGYGGVNLQVAPADEASTYAWKTTNTITTGAMTQDGYANTQAMITAGINLHPAAQVCVNKGAGWFLPSINELQNIGWVIPNNKTYWSSTDEQANDAMWLNTYTTAPANGTKATLRSVRCVKKLP